MESWERSWLIYHQIYNTLFDDWRAIPYKDLTGDRDALRAVCEFLSIEDYPGKERYWERTQHHVVGGNPSARVHLYSDKADEFHENTERSSSKIDVVKDGTYRSIYYDAKFNPVVVESVDNRIRSNPQILTLTDFLEFKDLRRASAEDGVTISEIQMPKSSVYMRRIKYSLTKHIAALRYGS